MKGKLDEPQADIEITDELPVLSEEALLERGRDERPTIVPAPTDALEIAIDTLRQTLAVAEKRWSGLEARLESQNDAIARLQDALGKPAAEPGNEAPTAETLRPQAAAPSDEIPELTDRIPEPAATPETAPENRRPAAERALLEKIATLESYIAGRADRWQAMEDELEAKSRQIGELEQELEQRVAREQNLTERLRAEGGRTRGLRDRLLRVTRQLETGEQVAAAAQPLDPTREIAASDEPIGATALGAADDAWPGSRPALVGLSADAPARCDLDREQTRIGRSADCEISLASHAVSRHHATIRCRDGRFVIEDDSSLNGVYVNEVRVTARTLEPGDLITIGESQFRFVAGG